MILSERQSVRPADVDNNSRIARRRRGGGRKRGSGWQGQAEVQGVGSRYAAKVSIPITEHRTDNQAPKEDRCSGGERGGECQLEGVSAVRECNWGCCPGSGDTLALRPRSSCPRNEFLVIHFLPLPPPPKIIQLIFDWQIGGYLIGREAPLHKLSTRFIIWRSMRRCAGLPSC